MLEYTYVLSEILSDYENKNIDKFSKCNYVAETSGKISETSKLAWTYVKQYSWTYVKQ